MLGKLFTRLFGRSVLDEPQPTTLPNYSSPPFSQRTISGPPLPPVSDDYLPHVVDLRAGIVTVYSAAGSVYEKSLAQPFWATAAKMERGAYARYGAVAGDWHVFRIVEGPLYGRREYQDGVGISVIAQRVTTKAIFTMPLDALELCDSSFVTRDGTPIRRGESDHRTADRPRRRRK